ncbi:MAG TPA: GNAT family N-acyltransferase [Rariglobus sp.]|jgi:putative hemolysin|nr:GNAT family N-acyltransferase [Rariglobus sp.]
MTSVVEPLAATDRYTLHLAFTPAQVKAAQRLRFEVFNLEMGEGLAQSAASGFDEDEFDAVCDHLLVIEAGSGEVVGTYRMQTGASAASHRGYYSAREFDFAPFEAARPEIVELGRACVSVAHRNQSVLGLLWKGIARYAQSHRARYLVGCSSLTSQDPARGLLAYAQLAGRHLAPPAWRTAPLPAWRCAAEIKTVEAVPVPRLMSAYLSVGAKICGEPAIDREFGTIDFLTWMDLQSMPARVWRKFMG